MVQLVQRPRGPEGHSSYYQHLPWPSDVTQQQIDSWLVEFQELQEARFRRHRQAQAKSPSNDKFWVVAPDRVEPLSIEADTMELSAEAQTIMLLRGGVLVASMPSTYFCVKAGLLAVHK